MLNICGSPGFVFQAVTRSTKFVNYLCQEVLPFINQLGTESEIEDDTGSSLALDLLKISAELLHFAGNLEDIEEKVATVYSKLTVSNFTIEENRE